MVPGAVPNCFKSLVCETEAPHIFIFIFMYMCVFPFTQVTHALSPSLAEQKNALYSGNSKQMCILSAFTARETIQEATCLDAGTSSLPPSAKTVVVTPAVVVYTLEYTGDSLGLGYVEDQQPTRVTSHSCGTGRSNAR